MADMIQELGVLFVSKLDPKFGDNVNVAVKNFEEKIAPSIKQIQKLFNGLAVSVTAFYKMMEAVPAINLVKSIDMTGLTEKMVGTFKDARAKSMAEFKGLTSEISAEVNKLSGEFAKLEKWTSELRAGENPIVAWGDPAWSAKRGKKPYFPESKRAIDEAMMREAPEEVIATERQARITEYAQRQLQVYQQMVGLIGQMGAFERARLATSELIAQRAQEEIIARQKVAEFVGITKELLSRGLLAGGVDEAKLKSMKQYLDELIKTEEGRKVLNQELDVIMSKIVKDEQAVKDIILSSIGDKEKILAITKQIADQYEKIKSSSIGMTGGGFGGGGVDWDILIGKIQLAGAVVSQFQQKLQTIQIKAFINPDEFTRLSSIAQAINSEITDLTNRIARLGSQSVAREMAKDWDVLRADIEKTGQAFKEAGALQGKGLPVTNVVDLDKAVYGLTTRLKELAQRGQEVQLQALQAGLAKTNAEIQQLTGGVDINRKSLKQLGLSTLELEKLQSLLTNRMKLIREEFSLTGKATAQMNAAMKSTGESLGVVQYQVGQFTKRSADASRAMDRWGAGFVDMLKSQMAWLVGGALIFGTVFKIQQAFSEAIGTIFKFRQAIIDVGAITNASAGDMKILEKAARDIATSTKMGFIEAADALKILGQAGLTAKESAEALKTVAMLVTATGASSQEAVKVLTTAMNVWKLSATESTRVGNVFAAALNYSKLEIGDLSTAFNYYAATSKLVGNSIERTAAELAVLSNAGLKASTMATGLRGIIGQLISPSANFRKELDAIGVDFEDIRMPGHNLIEILGVLEKKGFDLTNIFEGLEKRQAGVFAALSDMGPAALQRMTDALTGTNAMLVMNERAMEGPMNQLHIFKTRLLDVALSISDIVVPAFNVLIKGLGGLTETFKMLWPVFIGAGVIAGISALITHFDLLTTASTRLGLSLLWLKAHWVIAGLALLAVGVTAVKLAYDALNKSNEDYIKQIDREVMLYVQQVGELEALRVKLKTVAMSQDEIRDAVNNLSGEYKDLKDMVNQVGMTHTEVKTKVIAEIDEMYKKIQTLKFDRLKLVIEDLHTAQKKLDEAHKKYQLLKEPVEVSDFGMMPPSKRDKRDALEDITKKTIATAKLKKEIDDFGRSVKSMADELRTSEEALWDYLTGEGWSTEDIKLAVGGLRKALQEETDADAKTLENNMKARISAMQSALFEMQKALATEEGKIRLEYKKGMAEYPERGYPDTEKGVEAAKLAAKGRAAVQEVYDRKMRELRAKERNTEVQEELKIEEAGLRDSLELAGREQNMRLRIQKETDVKMLLELVQWQKEKERIQYEIATGAIKTPGAGKKLQDQARNTYFSAIDKLKEGSLLRIKEYDDKLDNLSEQRRVRQIQAMEELGKAELDTAEDTGEQLRAQTNLTNLAILKANEDLAKEIHTLLKQYEGLGPEAEKDFNDDLDTIIAIFKTKIKTIETEGEHKGTDILRKGAEREMKVKIEEKTRYLREERKALQDEFDAMSETVRESEYGKYIKNQLDLVTISLDETTKSAIEFTISILEGMQRTPEVVAALSQLRQEYDGLTGTISKAKQEVKKFDDAHSGIWRGFEAGWKSYFNKIGTAFDLGMKAMEDACKVMESSFSTLFEDALTNKLKSFKDYFTSFGTSLIKIWSDMLAKMVMKWIGFEQSTQGTATGGKNLWKLVGGAVGAIGSLAGLGGVSSGVPTGASSGSYGGGFGLYDYHRGGTIKKMHEGGLQRDEVIAKLLTNEYVLRRESAQSIGREQLDYMNREGRIPRDKPVIVPAPEVRIVNLLDPRAIVAKALYDQPNLIINPITANSALVRRILGT